MQTSTGLRALDVELRATRTELGGDSHTTSSTDVRARQLLAELAVLGSVEEAPRSAVYRRRQPGPMAKRTPRPRPPWRSSRRSAPRSWRLLRVLNFGCSGSIGPRVGGYWARHTGIAAVTAHIRPVFVLSAAIAPVDLAAALDLFCRKPRISCHFISQLFCALRVRLRRPQSIMRSGMEGSMLPYSALERKPLERAPL